MLDALDPRLVHHSQPSLQISLRNDIVLVLHHRVLLGAGLADDNVVSR